MYDIKLNTCEIKTVTGLNFNHCQLIQASLNDDKFYLFSSPEITVTQISRALTGKPKMKSLASLQLSRECYALAK